jgi:hypothetical protein
LENGGGYTCRADRAEAAQPAPAKTPRLLIFI